MSGRRTIQAVADGLRHRRPSVLKDDPAGNSFRRAQWHEDVEIVADAYAETVHGFDRERFLKECGA